MRHYDVAVIGAGVVGCAIARQLAQYELDVVVFERSNDVGTGTSKANTAILHTGFDTVPGSLESRLVRRGHDLLADYATKADIALEKTGALLVAWNEEQYDRLDDIVDKARANGYDAAREVDVDDLYRREPHLGLGALGALAIADEWIICPWSTSIAFATEAVEAGVDLRLRVAVTGATRDANGWTLATSDGSVASSWVINAAGLYSDTIDRMFGHERFTVTPRRGQLIVFDKLARSLISSILLPVPTERTKGVVVLPTVYGNVLLGPTAEDLDDRDDTASTAEGIAGLLKAGRAILPSLLNEEVTATYAGLRAATEHRDYQIEAHDDERYVCVGGIRSTGLSASMAIGEYVAELLATAGMDLREKSDAPRVPQLPPLAECATRPYENAELIERDPTYGTLVCFCERVSEGELRDAMNSTIPAVDLAGLRRRTRVANGRCQGFYCGANVAARLNGAL